MRTLLTLTLLAAYAPAAPVPKALKKQADDATLIVGTWKPTEGQTAWFEFTADGKMKAWETGGTAATGLGYTWTLDPTTDPKSITWGNTLKQPQWDGVYELDGDTLRVTYNVAGRRPKKVEAAPGQHFCELRRHSPD